MNRRAFLVALACVPSVVVAKAQVEPVTRHWDMGKGTSLGGKMMIWQKGPTVVTFPAGARFERLYRDLDGGTILCYCLGDRFYTMKQDKGGVYR